MDNEYPKTHSDYILEWGRRGDKIAELQATIERYQETLHDGYAVACKLTEAERRYTTPENVSAVLDAFKRALSLANA